MYVFIFFFDRYYSAISKRPDSSPWQNYLVFRRRNHQLSSVAMVTVCAAAQAAMTSTLWWMLSPRLECAVSFQCGIFRAETLSVAQRGAAKQKVELLRDPLETLLHAFFLFFLFPLKNVTATDFYPPDVLFFSFFWRNQDGCLKYNT